MKCSTDRLTNLTPQCRWQWSISSTVYGYRLETWHAHVGGLLADCPSVVYGPLTYQEMSDVLCVLIDEIAQAPADLELA